MATLVLQGTYVAGSNAAAADVLADFNQLINQSNSHDTNKLNKTSGIGSGMTFNGTTTIAGPTNFTSGDVQVTDNLDVNTLLSATNLEIAGNIDITGVGGILTVPISFLGEAETGNLTVVGTSDLTAGLVTCASLTSATGTVTIDTLVVDTSATFDSGIEVTATSIFTAAATVDFDGTVNLNSTVNFTGAQTFASISTDLINELTPANGVVFGHVIKLPVAGITKNVGNYPIAGVGTINANILAVNDATRLQIQDDVFGEAAKYWSLPNNLWITADPTATGVNLDGIQITKTTFQVRDNAATPAHADYAMQFKDLTIQVGNSAGTPGDITLSQHSAASATKGVDIIGVKKIDNHDSSVSMLYWLEASNLLAVGGAMASGDTLDVAENNTTTNLKSNIINMANIPTGSGGLSSGDIWANSNVLTVVP